MNMNIKTFFEEIEEVKCLTCGQGFSSDDLGTVYGAAHTGETHHDVKVTLKTIYIFKRY